MDNPNLPVPELEVFECEPNRSGESNTVHRIVGRYQGMPLTAFLKTAKNPSHHLANEHAVLNALASSDIPVPRVLWVSDERDVLLLEAIDGVMIWDVVDPRRKHYDKSNVLSTLHRYGEMLGRIHHQDLECLPQPRTRLYSLIGEERTGDLRFQPIIDWLRTHEITHQDRVFVHGDYNSGNVILSDGIISGIVDWEYAGCGWKEYELAWALRARMSFLNTQSEYEAFLQGYCQYNTFDAVALRWCEIMNYLHDAYWSLEENPVYTDFSVAQALRLMNCPFPR